MPQEPTGLSMMQAPRQAKPTPPAAAEGGDYPKITPPATYAPPEDKQPGETFEAIVECRVEEDGRLCLLKMDGVPLNEAPQEESQEEEMEDEAPVAPQSLAEAVAAQRKQGYGRMS